MRSSAWCKCHVEFCSIFLGGEREEQILGDNFLGFASEKVRVACVGTSFLPESRGCGQCSCCTIVTWLILPAVICLSQRPSHACLSVPAHTGKLCIAYLVATYNKCFTICNKFKQMSKLILYSSMATSYERERERGSIGSERTASQLSIFKQ